MSYMSRTKNYPELESLSLAKLVAIYKKYGGTCGAARVLHIRQPRLSNLLKDKGFKVPLGGKTARQISHPHKSASYAYSLGVLFGDGDIIEGRVKCTAKDREMVYYFGKGLMDFNIEPCTYIWEQKPGIRRIPGNYLYSCEFYSTVMARYLYRTTRNKTYIPAWIYSEPRYARAFLGGFFDAEGCVWHGGGSAWNISFNQGVDNKIILEQVSKILDILNIVYTFKDYSKRPNPHFLIRISNLFPTHVRFSKCVFHIPRKAVKMEEWRLR